MLTVLVLLAISAFVVAIVHAMGKAPLWPAVLVLAVLALLQAWPAGR